MDDKIKGDGFAKGSVREPSLTSAISIQQGHIDADMEKHGNLHRTLTPRMIHVCSSNGRGAL